MLRFFLVLLLSAFGFADNKDFIVIEKDEVIQDDFFASSSVVEISGICKKDVYIYGTQILVDGIIEGDLICFAGSLQVTGQVKGSIRGIVGQALIAGTIGKNITLVAGAFTSTPTASFLANVFIAASTVDLAGNLNQDLYVGATNVRYGAQSLNNLHLYAGTIRIGSHANVKGYIEYNSPKPIDVQKGAVIGKEIYLKNKTAKLYSKSVIFEKFAVGSKIAAALMNLFFTLIIGILFINIWPNTFVRCLNNLKNQPLKSLINGIIFVIAVPLIGLILLITILGIPIAVTLIAFSVLGLYSSKIYTIYYFADAWKTKYNMSIGEIGLFSILCVVYFALQLIPYLGVVLSWTFTLAGLGGCLYLPKIIKSP